jgi:aprataxin
MLLVEPAGEARDALDAARLAEPGLAVDGRFALAPATATLPHVRAVGVRGARVLCNAANHKLSGKGGGVNKAVHVAAGVATLEALTAALHAPSGRPGHVYAVELPRGNPLREAEGVQHVVHVVGPNVLASGAPTLWTRTRDAELRPVVEPVLGQMNAERPQCLHGDYAVGCAQLGDTYAALFAAFANLLPPAA